MLTASGKGEQQAPASSRWGGLIVFELQQEGPKVTGTVRFSGGSSIGAGALEGCLGGDAFDFTVRSVDGTWTDEATVNGDEMNGTASWFTGVSFHGQNTAKSNIRRMLPGHVRTLKNPPQSAGCTDPDRPSRIPVSG